MASATFGGNRNYNLREHVWLIRQEVNNNRSLMGWQLWIDKTSGSGYRSSNPPSDREFRLDGVLVGANSGGGFNLQGTSNQLILSGESWINHNADGTKTLAIQGNANYDILGSAEVRASTVLPTIPRASTATFTGGATFDAGTAVTINTNRAAAGFTHDITWHFGSQSGTIGTGVGTSISWTPPMSMLTAIPNAATGTGHIAVTTKSGSTIIGSRNTNFTLQAPASVVPTINAPTLVDDNATVNSIVGAYVQGLSRLKATVTGAGVYSSSISTAQFSIGNLTASSGGTIELPTSGTVAVVSKVTDSRGRSATRSNNITVLAYNPPKINSLVISRFNPANAADKEGTSLRVTLNAVASSLVNGTQKNSLGIRVYTRLRGTTPWVARNVINHSAMTYNTNFVISGGGIFALGQAFDVRVEVFDKFNTDSAQTVVTTANVYMHWAPAGVGYGKYHERGTIDVAGDIYNRSGSLIEPIGIILPYAAGNAPLGWVVCDGRTLLRSEYSALFALIGTTYGAGDGSTTFNVPNMAGRVPIGWNSNDTDFSTPGKTGGEKTTTLTTAQLPAHNHGFVGGNSFSWGPSGNVHIPTNANPGAGSLNWLHTFQHDWNKTANAGSGQAHNNLPPYITLNYIIKAL